MQIIFQPICGERVVLLHRFPFLLLWLSQGLPMRIQNQTPYNQKAVQITRKTKLWAYRHKFEGIVLEMRINLWYAMRRNAHCNKVKWAALKHRIWNFKWQEFKTLRSQAKGWEDQFMRGLQYAYKWSSTLVGKLRKPM